MERQKSLVVFCEAADSAGIAASEVPCVLQGRGDKATLEALEECREFGAEVVVLLIRLFGVIFRRWYIVQVGEVVTGVVITGVVIFEGCDFVEFVGIVRVLVLVHIVCRGGFGKLGGFAGPHWAIRREFSGEDVWIEHIGVFESTECGEVEIRGGGGGIEAIFGGARSSELGIEDCVVVMRGCIGGKLSPEFDNFGAAVVGLP